MKIYTKTGDGGTTSLVGGKRVRKDSVRLNAYGTVDELNSFVGLLRCKITESEIDRLLNSVQNRLFDVGSYLATEEEKLHLIEKCLLMEDDILPLEQAIDLWQAELEPLRSFILPCGNERVSVCHICRTVTRRLEREMVAIDIDTSQMRICLKYVNRLSDFFFVLARKIAKNDGINDFLWEN